MSMFVSDRSDQILNLNGKVLTADMFRQETLVLPSDGIYRDICLFLKDWFNDSPLITVHTSGSTGKPKAIQVAKDRMQASAEFTCKYLGLTAGSRALLCLPVSYIAGKMMLVRALVSGFRIDAIEVNGHPFSVADQLYDFVALIPLQVVNSLNDELEKERLQSVKNVIVGGAAIDPELEKQLCDFPNAVYSTYGMTETLSHIAMRRVSGLERSLFYEPLDEVNLSMSDKGTLEIYAPRVCAERLQTNDCVVFNEQGAFRIIGRVDNVINSGGVKLQIEEIESKIASAFRSHFAITSVPDMKLGERVVLLYEGFQDEGQLEAMLKTELSVYEYPKHILRVSCIPLTESGKIKRKECSALAINLLT